LGVTVDGAVDAEIGWLDRSYQRLAGWAEVGVPIGISRLELRANGGAGSTWLPRHRAFVLGGQGTLLGEPYRRYGGREMVLGRATWRFPVPFLDFGIGALGNVLGGLTVGPYLAMGWTASPVSETPWLASEGVRPVAGLSLELFRLLVLEFGIPLRGGSLGVSFDLTRELWDVL
jgi:hypothetical protein